MRDFIAKYNKEFKATIILTSHNMDDVAELAQRLIIISKGRIIFDDKLSRIFTKFADSKLVTLDLKNEVPKEEFAKFGKVISYKLPQVAIEVPRKNVAQVTQEILAKMPILDLSISERPVEEIIREIFTKK